MIIFLIGIELYHSPYLLIYDLMCHFFFFFFLHITIQTFNNSLRPNINQRSQEINKVWFIVKL